MLVKQRKVIKPWGYEIIWSHCEKFVGKILFIEDLDEYLYHVSNN